MVNSSMANKKLRVRFPPSPTGEPHVGNIRTAIYNWLFARHNGGSFIVRIEDTDRERFVEGAAEEMLDALRWLGLEWDEGPDVGGDFGPYYQSQRLELYTAVANQLVEQDKAYLCYCSSQRLAEMRAEQARLKQHPGYDRRCRDLSGRERGAAETDGPAPVVRFKMPLEGTTTLNDLVRGEVSFENRLMDDFVILKSDGFPTYHLAALADDHHMQISHVLRGEDWLPSAPRHLLLYEALGWEPPQYLHLPLILASDRSKLSKRHGPTSVMDYREMGYLPQAMVNFLTLLGWSLDDKTEIIPVDELIGHFTVERIASSGAVFNVDKLTWMNGQYIRHLSDDELAGALLDYWRAYPAPEIPEMPDRESIVKLAPLVRDRLKTLADAAPLIAFFFRDEAEYDGAELVQKGMDPAGARRALEAALGTLGEKAAFDAESLEGLLRPLAEDLGLKAGQLFGTLRIATTGQPVAPPLFETMEVLGKDRTLSSIRKAIAKL